MALSRWVYRQSDGVYLRGGFFEPEHDPATEAIEVFGDANPHPDPRTERGPGRRRATVDEVTAYDRDQAVQRATSSFDTERLIKSAVLAILDEIDGRHPANPVDRAALRQRIIDRASS